MVTSSIIVTLNAFAMKKDLDEISPAKKDSAPRVRKPKIERGAKQTEAQHKKQQAKNSIKAPRMELNAYQRAIGYSYEDGTAYSWPERFPHGHSMRWGAFYPSSASVRSPVKKVVKEGKETERRKKP